MWVLFLYVAPLVTLPTFIEHFLRAELDLKLAFFLMTDALVLGTIAWIYNRLPVRPQHRAFKWLELPAE